MSEYPVTVRRVFPGQWYLAPVGAVMVLHAGGVLFGWLPTRRILELIYPGKEPPVLESRDHAWAWAFLIIGVLLIVWTAGRLAGRRPVVRAGAEGILLSLGGPFTRPALIPWDDVGEVSASVASGDYGTFPALDIEVADPSLVGSSPWGARWVEDGVLSISAEEWAVDSGEVAVLLVELQASRSVSPSEDPAAREGLVETDMTPAPPEVPETEAGPVTPAGVVEGGSD